MLNETSGNLSYWISPDTITAYSTVCLAIITGALVLVTWKYVREVKGQAIFLTEQVNSIKRQAETMDSQFQVIREESATMKRQADAMEGQSSLMFKNMEYDRLVKKYERVNKELEQLIAPLYSRRKETNLFQLQNFTDKFKASGYNKYSESHFYYVDFWESIERNMYLNRSPDFELSFRNYFMCIVDYFQVNDSSANNERKKELEDLFYKSKRPDFIGKIENRYSEISNELKDIENELILFRKA